MLQGEVGVERLRSSGSPAYVGACELALDAARFITGGGGGGGGGVLV